MSQLRARLVNMAFNSPDWVFWWIPDRAWDWLYGCPPGTQANRENWT